MRYHQYSAMKKITHHEGKFKRFVSIDGWEFVERVNHCGIVVILVVTKDRKVILVEQFRVPVGKQVIEFPGGLADGANGHEGESLEEAAKRELLEETGYAADEITYVGSGPISSASTSDIMHTFCALNVRKVAKGGGDSTENITVHEVELERVDDWLNQKEKEDFLIDPKVFAGFYHLKRYLSS